MYLYYSFLHYSWIVFESVFPSSVQVNNETLSFATKQVQSCQAVMGNTDIWRPLHSLYLLSDAASVSTGGLTNSSTLPPRSLFVISDGHMTEEAPSLSAIKDGAQNYRVFTFGVRYVEPLTPLPFLNSSFLYSYA